MIELVIHEAAYEITFHYSTKTTSVDYAEQSLNATIISMLLCPYNIDEAVCWSLTESFHLITDRQLPKHFLTEPLKNRHGEEGAFCERFGSFPFRNCDYFMVCTQNPRVSCGFAMESRNCWGLIIYRQVKAHCSSTESETRNILLV